MRIIEDAALSAILNGMADNETHQIMLHAIQERDEMESDNDRLRAALAPVLAVPTDSLTGLWGVPLPDGGMMLTPEGVANAMRFVDAVREAQRIYNGEDDE